MTVGDLVMRRVDGTEGYIAAELGDVEEEDDYGDMPNSTPARAWVMWDEAEFPEHISRERLVKIAGFRIHPVADGESSQDLSHTFSSRNEAVDYRTNVLSDFGGEHYSIVPVDEQGDALCTNLTS